MWFWTIKTRARLNPKGMPKIVKPFVTTNFVTLIGRRTGKHGDVFSVMLGAYEKHTDGARCKQSEAYFLRSQEDVVEDFVRRRIDIGNHGPYVRKLINRGAGAIEIE